MKCIRYYIEYPSRTTIIKIKPFFDVHWGNKYCDERAFRTYLKEHDEHTHFVGGGDLLDSIIVRDPRYRKSVDKYSQQQEAIIDDAIGEMAEILYPVRNRLIGLGSGNHEDNFLTRTSSDPTQRLCDLLSTKEHPVHNLGYSWLVTLILKRRCGKTRGGGGTNLVLRGHHGWGGGSRTLGADLTKYSRDMAYWDADIYLYGHVHRRQSAEVPRMGISGTRLVSKPKLMAICGTWLKTYSNDEYPTYSEAKGYPPTEIGGVTLQIKELKHGFKWWVQ